MTPDDTARTPPGEDFFPVSVWCSGGRARAPMLSPITPTSREEWRADLVQIRDLGFNCVRTWIAWAQCEPRKGEFRFDNLRLLCELAEEVGLRVFLQVYAESTPMWLEERFPEAAFMTQSGEVLRSQSVPGLCTDHPGVQGAMLAFYRAAAEVVLTFPSFHAWDLWSEPHIVNWTILSHVPNVQFCHCESTQRRFRNWLRARYETLGRLGEAWGRIYPSWDHVRAPQFGTILTYTDFLDWKAFIFEKMAEDLHARAEAVREVDPDHLITSHAAVPSGMTSPLSEWGGYGATDDFLMARVVDRYGLSLYPKHSFPDRHWEGWKIDFALNFAHSANRRNGGFVVGELQAGHGTRGVVVGDPVTPHDTRRWMWSCIARGARAVNIFAYHPMTSGYEAGGYGLIHTDGRLTERAEEAGRIARVVTRRMETFTASRHRRAEVAILYNPLAQLVGGEQSCGPTSLHPDSLIGYQRVFARRGVPVDFVHRTDLECGELSGHRLLIVPHPIMLTREAAEGLRRFVEEGGFALAEARLAWNDERGFTTGGIPGMGLHEVFGARESAVTTRERVDLRFVDSDHPALNGIAPGSEFTGAHFGEALEPLVDSETLATLAGGEPAVIASRCGEGQTILVGSFLGVAQRLWPEATRERFLWNLLGWAGVNPPFTSSLDDRPDTPVAIHLHDLPGGHLLFLINHGESAETITVILRTDREGDCRCTDLIDDSAGELSAAEGRLAIETVIAPRDVRVLEISFN
ncbi:beta-galactosidase [Candidatus Sumerlaeota bacterium]|nr:beta-galactosidase [Candidatus Sumerlaeota bacterium]